MEPVSTTTIYLTLSWFIGYYIGGDLYDYYKARKSVHELTTKLNEIKYKLDKIDNRLPY